MRGEPIRAAVISDTHGLLRPEVERVIQTCDVVIHAGDFDSQMLYHKLNVSQPLYGVRGNNDGYWSKQLPKIRRFCLGGVSFLAVHDQADVPADLQDVQVVIFGHSHMYYQQERDGRLWLNPGSCGYRRFHLPLSMAVMTIQDGTVSAEPIWLEEEGRKEEHQTVYFSPVSTESGKTESSRHRSVRERLSKARTGNKDQLFLIAKIMRFMKRGDSAEWVAGNLKADPGFVEQIYRIVLTHPGIDARQVMDKMEVNRLYQKGYDEV